MSQIPDEIKGLGKTAERWQQNPLFDLQAYAFDRDSYFIWSRFDGHTSLRDVILMVGLPMAQTVKVIHELRTAGALLRPGEEPERVAARIKATRERKRSSDESKTADARKPARASLTLDELTDEEAAVMALELELTDKVKLRVLSMRRRIMECDYFELFGVDRDDVDKRTLKRAYFKLSKEFHPDRYYRKNTGPFGPWLGEIFQAVTGGFQTLSDPRERERYLASLLGRPAKKKAQSREEHAAELFERACNAESHGQIEQALKLFSAATRIDGQVHYYTRAARCATGADALETAEEYARRARERAPDDPSVARILSDVYRRMGRLREAEALLVRALAIKSENDQLTAGLRADLESVRSALARSD